MVWKTTKDIKNTRCNASSIKAKEGLSFNWEAFFNALGSEVGNDGIGDEGSCGTVAIEGRPVGFFLG